MGWVQQSARWPVESMAWWERAESDLHLYRWRYTATSGSKRHGELLFLGSANHRGHTGYAECSRKYAEQRAFLLDADRQFGRSGCNTEQCFIGERDLYCADCGEQYEPHVPSQRWREQLHNAGHCNSDGPCCSACSSCAAFNKCKLCSGKSCR